jgi:RNA polymerase sigma factor (sigma-70 family)
MDIGSKGLRVNNDFHDFSDEPEVEDQVGQFEEETPSSEELDQSELAETEDGAVFARLPADPEMAAEIEAEDEAAAEQAELEADLPQRVTKPKKPKRQPRVGRAEERALTARVQSKEPRAPEVLCERFEGFLIHHVDREYGAWTLPFEDKLAIARLGLIDAARKFDLSSTFRLTTLAKWWIKARFSEANERDGLIANSVVKRGRKQRKADAEASRENMLGGSVWIRFSDVSLDAPVGGEDNYEGDGEASDGHDDLAYSDAGEWVEGTEATLDKAAAVKRANLTWREREFFRWRFIDKLTQEEIAEKRGVTASRIGQIEAALRRKLAIAVAEHKRRQSECFSIPPFGARYGLRRPSARHQAIVRRLHNQWPGWPDRILWPGELIEGRPSACYSTPRLLRMAVAA